MTLTIFLSSIFGSLNLLRKRVPDNEKMYTDLIDNIENCSIRARDLTKGLIIIRKTNTQKKRTYKTQFAS